ncbi:MAG: beta-N-acetylhexosaminidase [Candidatus Parcubacteria bacterium]|nr:beta-N-acetylhexosaminidase [Candidatus Parcubacteria bacterium]
MKKFYLFLFVFIFLTLSSNVRACDWGCRNIYYGLNQNSDVKILQQFLKDNNYYQGPVTGNFLFLTKKAVIDFQIKNNIAPASGYVGSQTLSAIDIIRKKDQLLKDQIGQMFIVGFRGLEATEDSYIVKAIKDLNLGGIILFDYDTANKSSVRNISASNQVKKLISDIKTLTKKSLLVAVDAEGGYVNRLKTKYGYITIPSALEMGTKNDVKETEKIGADLGKQLSELGFNMDFAPVLDVNVNPTNPVIGNLERSFSDNPDIVVSQAEAFIKGLHQYNIITAAKHFPGHGSSQADSHKGLVDVTNTYQQKELIPYEKLIKNNQLDLVMTAHIVNTKIDPEYPATLSPLFLQNILRNQLKFQGVIVSDDMQMGAISQNYGFSESVVRAVIAGCDLLIISNNASVYDGLAPYTAQEAIFKAVKQGQISATRIQESYDRIKNLKEKFKI